MSYPENIHPWTIDWFETLPQSYQYLDRLQKNPEPPPWDGLNHLPFDFTENGGWTVQHNETDRSDITQDFSSTPGEKVFYQIWVTPAQITGGSVHIYVYRLGGGELVSINGSDTLENVDTPSMLEGWFYPPADGRFTVLISSVASTISGPVILDPYDSTIIVLTTSQSGPVSADPTDSTVAVLTTGIDSSISEDPNAPATVVLTPPDTATPVAGSIPNLDATNVSRRIVTYEELPTSGSRDDTYFPLLRFMDGIGQIGGRYREVSDDLWDGIYTNPDTCPDSALRWLAQMMGIHRNVYGVLDDQTLRDLLKRTSEQGLAAIGSRSSLQEVFKAFLTGDQTCNVVPHPTDPHTIRVRVVLSEVPGEDLAILGAQLRASGTVPAGHLIQIVEGNPTWDQWETAAGATWAEYEAKTTTWTDHDTLGVTFD